MSEALAPSPLPPEIEVNDVLSLRLLEPDDSEDVFRILQDAPEIQSYVTWTASIKVTEDVRAKIEEFQEKGDRRYALLEGQQVIGYGALYNSWINIENEYEIGYFCAPEKRGRGYTKATAIRLMEVAREILGAQSFALYIDDGNSPSKTLAASLGFVPTEEFKEDPVLNCLERRYEQAG